MVNRKIKYFILKQPHLLTNGTRELVGDGTTSAALESDWKLPPSFQLK